jgi:small subunit ribosomal protein S16
MAIKIRLWQQGRVNSTCYRVVVADSRSPRDGKYIEAIGWYNPRQKSEEQQYSLHEERLQHWLSVGAQPSATVVAIAKKAAPATILAYCKRGDTQRAKRAAKRKA